MSTERKYIMPRKQESLTEGRLEDFVANVRSSVESLSDEIGENAMIIATFLDHAIVCNEDNRLFRLGLTSDGEVASIDEEDSSLLFGGPREFSLALLERLESLSSRIDSDASAFIEYSRLLVREERRWFFDALQEDVSDVTLNYRKWRTLAASVDRSMLAEGLSLLNFDPSLEKEGDAIRSASGYRDWKSILESLSGVAYNLIQEDRCEILESESEYADAYSELRSDVMRIEQVLSSTSRFARFAPSDQLRLLSERTRNALIDISRARVAIGVNTHESR